MNKDEWIREMSRIDPGLKGHLDVLWHQLAEAPQPSDEAMRRRIWVRLNRVRSPMWAFARAWRISWMMLPLRRTGILLMGPLLAVFATRVVPIPYYVDIAWWGLLSPWAGLLAVPILNRSAESSPWAEWEAAAPLDPGLRLAVDWFAMMGVIALVAGLASGMVAEPMSRLHLLMMWLGPFGFTSIGSVLLMRQLGAIWSVVLTSAFWGSQTLIGSIAMLYTKSPWTLWFVNMHASFWPDITALAVGGLLAVYVGQRGWRPWISD